MQAVPNKWFHTNKHEGEEGNCLNQTDSFFFLSFSFVTILFIVSNLGNI